MKIKPEALILVLVFVFAAFFSFWKINTVPRDLDFDPIMLGFASWRLAPGGEVSKVHLENIKEYNYPDARPYDNPLFLVTKTGGGLATVHSYTFTLTHIPRLLIFKLLGGIDTVKILLTEALLALGAVILTYLLGSRMFNRWVGLLGAFFLASSSSFLMINRNPLGYPILSLLTLLLTIYFFYRAHQEKNRKFLLFSAASLSLVFLVEWTGVIIAPVILLLSFLFLPKNLRFKIYYYLIFIFISILVYFFLKSLYILVFRLPLDPVIAQTTGMLFGASKLRETFFDPWNSWQTTFVELFTGTKKLEASYYAEYLGSYFPGSPIVSLPISFFLFWGAVKALWSRSFAERILLSWVLVVFILYPLRYLPLPRYLMLGYPVLFLLSANGFCFILSFVRKILAKFSLNFAKEVFMVGLVLIVIANSIFLYFYHFNQYEKKMNNSGFNGFAELFDYINALGALEKAQLVLGDGLSMRYTFILAQIPKEEYQITYWSFLAGSPISDMANYQNPPPYPWNPWDGQIKEKITAWEKKILTKKEKIIYVFAPNHSIKEVRNRLSSFYNLHPEIKQVKTIVNSDGTIRMFVFVVEKKSL